MESNKTENNHTSEPEKTAALPTKTIGLIILLILAVVVLVKLALPSTTSKNIQNNPIPTQKVNVAHTTLSFSPSSLTVPLSSSSSSLNVDINTGEDKVTGVQLELSYDPKVISNVKVTPTEGAKAFFDKPLVLYNKTDIEKGKVSFILGILPSSTAKTGRGTVATLSFNVLGRTVKETQISFISGTIVTAVGIRSSVLKSSSGATIVLTSQ